MRSGAGRYIYLFLILYHIFLILSNRSAPTLRENIMHIAGRQSQKKNRIWQDRSGTQSLAAAGGALTPSFQAYERPYRFESVSGKLAAIQTCQKWENFCIWGVAVGNSGQDSCPRPAEHGSKEKRGAVARLSYSLSTIAHTSDCSYDSRSSLSMTFLTSSLLIQPISECSLFISLRNA